MADKEEKILVFDPVLCTGCMRCMTTCSTYNTGATSLSKSRIHIVRHEGHAITRMDEEDDLIFEALTCRQCDKPYCMYFCPTRAISQKQRHRRHDYQLRQVYRLPDVHGRLSFWRHYL